MDAPDGRGRTPVMLAAEDGNTPMVRLLLEAGANVNALDNLGYQSLHWAATNRQRDGSTVKLLLEHGADPVLFRPAKATGQSLLRPVAGFFAAGGTRDFDE